MIQYSYQYCELVNNKKIRLIRLTKLSSVLNMKSLLFSFYLITIDYQNYDYLKKSIEYKTQIRRDAMTIDIAFWKLDMK